MTRADEAWQVGALVGRYRLEGELGRGGMGVVYAAVDEATGRRVAIKTLFPHSGPIAARRFAREGEAQAKVDEHPNVVRVHAAGEADGRRYLVMDLASGGDLAARLKKGPLPPLEAAVMARDLARGLAHVHARGVIHRDLKPANVLFDERGTPRLVDFGVAALDGAERLTRTGAVMGTPAYMAPEQMDGVADARADVYGLGALLFHMLTGRPPFEAGSAAEQLGKLLMKPAPSPRTLNPDVPEWLAQVVLECLAKRPDERYATATDLADALERAVTGERVEAPRAQGVGVVALVVAAFLLPVLGGLTLRLLRTAPTPQVVEATPVAATQTASSAGASPPSVFRDLPVPPTLGLPTQEREYGFQWHFVNGTPALRSVRGRLTLGPAAVADDGAVTCRGRLSGLVVWGGGVGLYPDLEYAYDAGEVVRFDVAITAERELTVTGFEGERRSALFALLPDEPLGPRDNPSGDRGGAWPGPVVRDTLTNELVGHLLGLSLPWLATANGVAPAVRDPREPGDLSAERRLEHRERVLLLSGHDDRALSPDASFSGTWTIDADGGLVRCELTEAITVPTHPGAGGGVWWFLGPLEELAAKERRGRRRF